MATPDDDVQQLVKQLMAGASPEESMALLDALMGRRTAGILEALQADEEPTRDPHRPRSMATGYASTCRAPSRPFGAGSSSQATSPWPSCTT
jgi:hypothetical protein